jgi:hypothetical protein
MGVTAAVGALVLGGGFAAKSVSDSNKAQKQAGAAAQEQATKSAQMEADFRKQQSDKESSTAMKTTRDAARNRQKAIAAGAQGPQSTILTGPMGNPGDYQGGGQKTLLGT